MNSSCACHSSSSIHKRLTIPLILNSTFSEFEQKLIITICKYETKHETLFLQLIGGLRPSGALSTKLFCTKMSQIFLKVSYISPKMVVL